MNGMVGLSDGAMVTMAAGLFERVRSVDAGVNARLEQRRWRAPSRGFLCACESNSHHGIAGERSSSVFWPMLPQKINRPTRRRLW